MCGEKILAIDEEISIDWNHLNVIDAAGKLVFPGFVDSLVHITGGGGEGGFDTRTPEVNVTDLTKAGVTTLVAALGTDSISRSLPNLLAKAKELNGFGLSCYVYSGSYHLPIKTITESLQSDIMLIQECIGVGEIAIADHRGSQPSYRQLATVAADARVGGMLSGKSGIVSIHTGPSCECLGLLREVVEKTSIPITQFYPTHINRSQKLLDDGIDFTKKGGYIDLTTSSSPSSFEFGEIKCSKALKYFLENDGDITRISFSSDGHASLPEFDSKGQLKSIDIGLESSLFEEVRDAIIEEELDIALALKVITSTPADILKLPTKGRLKVGFDADIVILDRTNLSVETVISRGNIVLENSEPTVKGRFE